MGSARPGMAHPCIAPSQRWGSIGLLAMLASCFLFSLLPLIVKLLNRFQPFELVLWRSGVVSILITTICLCKGINPLGDAKDRLLLFGRGAGGFLFLVTYYHTVRLLPLSDAVVLCYTSPVMTAVAAKVLLGEQMGRLDVLGSLLCFVGVILVSRPSFLRPFFGGPLEPLPSLGLLLALVASVLNASVHLLLRYARHVHPLVSANYCALISLPLCLAVKLSTGEPLAAPQGREWGLLLLFGLIAMGALILMSFGLAMETAGKATAMDYSQVAFSYMYSLLLLHQASSVQSTIGAMLIATWGVIALLKEYYSNRHEPQD
mmetsp:Transcript_64645/g.140779  ORF Transcript_64645/g.140779 Transcript_64645/m.140779 type:complete len:318 (+) Transcript_64645:52-1005(+)